MTNPRTIPGSRDPRPTWMGESEPWWLKAGRQAGLTDGQARSAWEAFLRLKGVTLKEVTTHILIEAALEERTDNAETD